MDDVMNNTVDSIQDNAVDEIVENVSEGNGSGAVLVIGAIAVAATAGIAAWKAFKIGDKIKEARVNRAKKVLEKYDSESEDDYEAVEVDDKHFVIEDDDK